MKSNNLKKRGSPESKHANQLVTQILLPIFLVTLAGIGISLLAILSTTNQPGVTEHWSKISLVLIILPALFGGLLLLATLIAFSFLLGKLNHNLPPHLAHIGEYVEVVGASFQRIITGSTRPVIFIKSIKAAILHFFKRK